VLVLPSPKFHCQEVGKPADVSVNCTAWPADGDAGLKVKDAARAGSTLTGWLALLEPEALVTVNITVYDPAEAKVWLGSCEGLVPLSPKLHCQEVGSFVEVSVKSTACPAIGEVGL
jgi:hypothetical protein